MLEESRLQTIICTTRLAEAKAFYGELLGFRLKGQSDGALVFDVGGGDLRLSPVPSLTPPEHTVVGFAVTDLEPTVAAMTARGIAFERFDGMPLGPHAGNGIITTPDGSRVAWFRDPDGNLLSVVQFSS